jgi:hypothetical protein
MTGLEALLDHLERGGEVTVYWSDRPDVCEFPRFSASTAYSRGCRCDRCFEAKREWSSNHRYTHRSGLRR